MNAVPVVMMDPEEYAPKLQSMIFRYGERLWRLRLLTAEVKMRVHKSGKDQEEAVRFIINNPSGYYLNINIYREVLRDGVVVYENYNPESPGPMHGLPVDSPYPTREPSQVKRYQAQASGTTYVYDFPNLFREALKQRWHGLKGHHQGYFSDDAFSCMELVLNESEELVPIDECSTAKPVGMVAWRMCLKTPECPEGREMIVIANDLTHVIGSFGPNEDKVASHSCKGFIDESRQSPDKWLNPLFSKSLFCRCFSRLPSWPEKRVFPVSISA